MLETIAPPRVHHAATGVASYDRAQFLDMEPVVSHVHSTSTMAALWQRDIEMIDKRMEVRVPSAPEVNLLVRTGSGLELPTRVAGSPRTLEIDNEGAIFIPSNVDSSWQGGEKGHAGWLHFHFPAATVFDAAEAFGFAFAEFAVWRSTRLHAMGRETLSILAGETPPSLVWDSLAWLLLHTISRELRDRPDPRDIRPHYYLAPWQLRKARDYLEANYAQDIRIADLAAIVRLSPFHFARQFQRSTGVPPYRYQVLIRLRHARSMLASSPLSVTEIALAVGYESAQAFTRAFRRMEGMSPTEYRTATIN